MTRREVLKAIAEHGDDAVEYDWLVYSWGGVPWETLLPSAPWDSRKWRLKPQEQEVELTMDDVPQGAEFRLKGDVVRYSPHSIGADGVQVGYDFILPWSQLKREYEMRPPGGEWVGCYKKVV
jgi:hypothetical protein